ncbi:MAG: DUF4270 domain-containing protein, partial [Prevotellaceae bacterium]|nr:DUF4270 domain-containing protein [Prevotellaceae bacterium]
MNYRNSKLFFIPVAVALLSACVNVDKTLGTDLVPDNYDVNVEYVEFDVPISTDSVGAVVTSSTSVGAVGYLNHPEFGLFTAGSVFRILPYTLNFDYGEGAVADSAILTISVSSRTQLSDKEPPQQLSLYRLNRDLAYSTAYYNNSLKENNDLGEKIADYTYEGGDTIKIKLKDDFVNELLEAADEVTSDSLFLKTVKGLYLKAEIPGTVAEKEGQVSYFSLTSTYITLHYHTSSDTSTAYYIIEQGTPNFNVYTHSSSSLTG